MKKERTLIITLLLALASVVSAQSNSTSEDYYFIDGVDLGEFGSYIPLEDIITPVDWRGRDFNDYPNYWDYYGVSDIYVDLSGRPMTRCAKGLCIVGGRKVIIK